MATNAVKPFDQNRDYSGGQFKAGKRFEIRQGDPRVHALFVEYTNFPKQAVTWDFRKRVIDLALDLFQGEYSWFIRQDANALLKDQNYAFVLDTVRFIASGTRKFSIHTWPALLTYEVPVVNESVEGRREIYLLTQKLDVPTQAELFIAKWLSHKGGFDDMMYTLNMLFGNVPEKVSTEDHSEQSIDFSFEDIDKAHSTLEFLGKCKATLEGYQTQLKYGGVLTPEQITKVGVIDKACKLKPGNLGLEAFSTVSSESIGQRLGDIGKRILAWLMEMIEKIEVYTNKYTFGLAAVRKRFSEIESHLDKGAPLMQLTVKSVPASLYDKGVFVGDTITSNEAAVMKVIQGNRLSLMKKYAQDLRNVLRLDLGDELLTGLQALDNEVQEGHRTPIEYSLPGNAKVDISGINIHYNERMKFGRDAWKDDSKPNVTFDAMSNSTAKKNIGAIVKYLEDLNDTSTASSMNTIGHELQRAIAKYERQVAGDPAKATLFEKVQSIIEKFILSLFQPRVYFGFLGDLANAQMARYHYYKARVNMDNVM